MKQFVVRFNVEFSLLVQAESELEAIEKANSIPTDDWDQKSTSQFEADEQ